MNIPAWGPIIVCGASRSGTSLVTRVLAGLGVFVGRDRTDDEESRYVQHLNRWLYTAAGAGLEHPDALQSLLDDRLPRYIAARYIERAMRRGSPYWGARHLWRPRVWAVKDPRFTFTWPIWQDVYPAMRLVHVQRHGADVAESLMHRRIRVDQKWQFALTDPARLERQLRKHDLIAEGRQIANLQAATWSGAFTHWQRYIDHAAASCLALGPQALTVRFEQLVAHPQDTIARLAAFCGVDVPAAPVIDIRGDRALAYRLHPASRAAALQRAAVLHRHGYIA